MISTLCKYKFSLKYIQTAFAFCTTLRRAYLADLMISTLLQAQICQSWLLWLFANLNLEFKSDSRARLNLCRSLQHRSILVISISSSISRTHQHWSILVISFQILTHHSLSSPFQLPISYLSRPFVESLVPLLTCSLVQSKKMVRTNGHWWIPNETRLSVQSLFVMP